MKDGMQLSDFEGDWRIDREITDALGPDARFEGKARFTRDAGGLLYAEDGVLMLMGQAPFAASRRYHWSEADEGRILVSFADGRPFHAFHPGAGPEAEHHCAPDHYRVAYAFGDWPDWTARWTVSGPRKDYRMVSRYRRGG